MNTKPQWWERWFTPFSKECQKYYDANKSQIDYYEKDVNWTTGERIISFRIAKGEKVIFKDQI